jgi:Sigma-70 region 2
MSEDSEVEPGIIHLVANSQSRDEEIITMGQVSNVTFVHFPQHGANAAPSVSPRTPGRRRRDDADTDHGDPDDLIQRAVLGDIDAAAELTARYGARLRALALTLIGDEREAKHLVECAFEEAFRGWPPERGRLDLWFARLVHREVRRRKRSLGLHS